MTLGAHAAPLHDQAGEATALQIFETYSEAAAEATRREVLEGLVAKVQKSPYGSGYTVRVIPVAFLTQPDLKQRFLPAVGYDDL